MYTSYSSSKGFIIAALYSSYWGTQLTQITKIHLESPYPLTYLQPSRGDYIFRAQVHSYLNPTNHCAECDACCDSIGRICTSREQCDNVFLYCVRVLGTPEPTLGTLEDTVSNGNRARRLQCIESRSSHVNSDGGSIDFSRPTLLGIPNPTEFPVIASEWEVSRVITNLQINVYVGILGYSVLSRCDRP